MSGVFQEVVIASMAAMVAGAVIWLLKQLAGNRLPPWFHYGIWAVVVLRLLVPIGWPVSEVSVYNFLPAVGQPAEVEIIAEPIVGTVVSESTIANPTTTAVIQSVAEVNGVLWWQVAAVVWLVGMMVLLLVWGWGYWRTGRQLAGERSESVAFAQLAQTIAPNRAVGLAVSKQFAAPFLFGLYRPMVVMPQSMFAEASLWQVAAAHELNHLRSRDHLVCLLLSVLTAIYWFNPAIWLIFAAIRRDMEVACDARVLAGVDIDERKRYGTALLAVATGRNPSLLVPSFGRSVMKQRLHQVLTPRRYGKTTVVVAWALVIILVVILLTGTIARTERASYVDYDTLARYETPYIGDNSKVGNLRSLLPIPNGYGESWFALDTDATPYGLRVYYDHFDREHPWDPYRQFTMDSNALLLFRYIHNLEEISFHVYTKDENIPRADRVYDERGRYQRADFEAKYDDLSLLEAADLESIISSRRGIDGSGHYNRIQWGDTAEWVIYRNGEPDHREILADGSVRMGYFALGSGQYADSLGQMVDVLGTEVHILLDSPEAIALGVTGVCQIDVSGWDSEISWHCDLSDGTKQALLEALGEPPNRPKTIGGVKRYLYPVYGEAGKYVYFDCQKDKIIAHGLLTGM